MSPTVAAFEKQAVLFGVDYRTKITVGNSHNPMRFEKPLLNPP
ncbi:MAG: hypothetical protein CM15mV133_270 [uncultured marine virus]|nr:MAG: hypothetical protein CM15mV133_270 [uncultured marine virus]